jgi:hypothetical protein
MNHKSLPVAKDMASKLFAAEEAIDAALNLTAELASFMPLARQEVRVSMDVGQDAIEAVLASMQMLSGARKRMIETHEALARTQESARLAPRNFGGFINKPGAHLAPGALSVVPQAESLSA